MNLKDSDLNESPAELSYYRCKAHMLVEDVVELAEKFDAATIGAVNVWLLIADAARPHLYFNTLPSLEDE